MEKKIASMLFCIILLVMTIPLSLADCTSIGGTCVTGNCTPGTHKINYNCEMTGTSCCSKSLCDIAKDFKAQNGSNYTQKQFDELLNSTKYVQYYDINSPTLKDYVNNYNQKCGIPANVSTVNWKTAGLIIGAVLVVGYFILHKKGRI